MSVKRYQEADVLTAARSRVAYAFNHFARIYVSFSGGKDSSVMFHLVMDEAIKRNRKVGVLLIDLEAQYAQTIAHAEEMFAMYAEHIEVHWVCLPMLLRNAVSAFQPRWCCWEPGVEWVRELPKHPGVISQAKHFDFFEDRMEFEEFMVLFGVWYGKGEPCCGFVGIRSDESLNRFRTVTSRKKECHGGKLFTTKVVDGLFNCYPIYDWRTEDLWRYHARFPEKPHNEIYDRMHQAGLSISQMRLCQPYGDDQRRGLWLYHILEPLTWFKLVKRVSGANSGSLYIEETGNINGYNKISKPTGHTWKSFCSLLLNTLPPKTREHFVARFSTFIRGWKGRGYIDGIPDEAPLVLENKHWAPSWRRLCKVILRNDHWCKGLGLTQPKSEAYARYMKLKTGTAPKEPKPKKKPHKGTLTLADLAPEAPAIEQKAPPEAPKPVSMDRAAELLAEPMRWLVRVKTTIPKPDAAGFNGSKVKAELVYGHTKQVKEELKIFGEVHYRLNGPTAKASLEQMAVKLNRDGTKPAEAVDRCYADVKGFEEKARLAGTAG